MFKPTRLISRKNTSPKDLDSVSERRSQLYSKDKDSQLLERCERAWQNLDDFRLQRARGVRFCYGDQWADTITVNGKTMTYRQYLMQTGNVVIQTNQIKNRVDTIIGVLVKEHNEPVAHAIDRDEQQFGEVVTAALQANCTKNVMPLLEELWMKDICAGGLALAYESFDETSGPVRGLDTWTSYVNPNMWFAESEAVDPRFWDMSLIGRFFYKTREELSAMFAHSVEDYERLKEVYPQQFGVFRDASREQLTDRHDEDDLVFMRTDDPSRCAVCEVWTRETKPRIRLHDTNAGTEEIVDADDLAYRKEIKLENERRKSLGLSAGMTEDEIPYIIGDGYGGSKEERRQMFMDTFWYCRFLAPDGTILWEGESPYSDRSHPFSICAFPFIDGKITGYLNDAIDHNIAINRAVVLHDWLLRSQAKGVTVVPKAIVPKDVSFEEFAQSWTSIDDMVFIDVKPGQEGLMPKVFFGASQNFDVGSLIATYSRLMDNGSPVNGALQGKTPMSGTSGTLYAQMTTNASTPIAAMMDGYHKFIEAVMTKKMKNIVQFYNKDRFAKIAGRIDTLFDETKLNLNEIGNIEYDLRVQESTNAPVFRAVINQDAKEFLMNGLISFEEYLEIADVPYADKILQGRQARQAEMHEAQQQGIVPTQGMETVQPSVTNPVTVPETENAEQPLTSRLPVGLQ